MNKERMSEKKEKCRGTEGKGAGETYRKIQWE